MVRDVDTVYLALRARILSGELAPGTVLDQGDVAQEFDVNEKKVRQVLSSLVGCGYSARTQAVYTVRGLNVAEVEEWCQIVCAVLELGIARVVLDGNRNGEQLVRLCDQLPSSEPVRSERFYLWTLEVYASLLCGQRSHLAEFLAQLVPPMFFRLLGLAEIDTKAGASFRRMVSQIIEAIRSDRDVGAATDACRTHFDALSVTLLEQLHVRNAGAGPDLLVDYERTVERRINGNINYITSPSAPKPMLPPLMANQAASVKVFLPD
jgi:DNA-binding GntR family transcriptional regulator